MTTALNDLAVGDRVWCLARVGTPYDVAAVDSDRGEVLLQPDPALGGGPRGFTLPESALWMVTREHWDQIWYWADRAGETYDVVVERFSKAHDAGDVITGYHYHDDIPIGGRGFITPQDSTAMSFRVHPVTPGFPTLPVEPVVTVNGEVVSAGPVVPLRVSMSSYRWALGFGDLVLNWEDFLAPEGV